MNRENQMMMAIHNFSHTLCNKQNVTQNYFLKIYLHTVNQFYFLSPFIIYDLFQRRTARDCDLLKHEQLLKIIDPVLSLQIS